MDYDMEELVPVVGKLAETYMAHESTSITYEKAEQLMGTVSYCIHELQEMCGNSLTLNEKFRHRGRMKWAWHTLKKR